MDLGGPFAVQLAVEEIDHDLAGKPVGSRLPLTLQLENVRTRQNQGLHFPSCR